MRFVSRAINEEIERWKINILSLYRILWTRMGKFLFELFFDLYIEKFIFKKDCKRAVGYRVQTDRRFVDQLIKEQVQASLPIRPAN